MRSSHHPLARPLGRPLARSRSDPADQRHLDHAELSHHVRCGSRQRPHCPHRLQSRPRDLRNGIANGCLDLARGDPAGADVIFTGTATALAAAVYGGHSLDTLAKAGSLSIDGDRAVAERFTTLFPLPPKVKKTR